MPYPPIYQPATDFAAERILGLDVDGAKLAAELARIAETVSQLRAFIRSLATADRRWQPASALAQDLVSQAAYTATAGQTSFDLPNSETADPATDKVRVFSGGTLVNPASVTLGTDSVTIPAQTAGAVVVVELFNDAESLRTDLASTLDDLGASLIGVEDALGHFSGDNVEEVLAEIGTQLDTIEAALIDSALFIKADGSTAFSSDQSMGGNKLTDLADATDPQDAATLAQLQALSGIYGDLAAIYLSLAGGTMSGPIDMNGSAITGLPDAEQADEPATKGQLDAATVDLGATYVTKAGDTMAGSLLMQDPSGAQDAQPDSTQPNFQPTFENVPKPTANDHVANKLYVDTLDSDTNIRIDAIVGAEESNAGCGVDGAVTSVSAGGIYNASSATLAGASTPPGDTTLYSQTTLTVSGSITLPAGYTLTLRAAGAIAINANITADHVVIESDSSVSVATGVALARASTDTVETSLAITAAGNVTIGATATIDFAIVEVDTDLVFSNAGTITALATSTGGERGSNTSSSGLDGFSLDGEDGYAGTGGSLGSAAIGGGGGAGGTAGGDGGDAQSDADPLGLGGEQVYSSANAPYALPLASGGGGGSDDNGALGGNAGGVIRVWAGQAIEAATGIFDASGGDGSNDTLNGGGGGGGGAIRLVTAGSVDGGALAADGGDGDTDDDDGGGGGGGMAIVVASSELTSPTLSAAGGSGGAGQNGSVGYTNSGSVVVLTAAQINCLKNQGVWSR